MRIIRRWTQYERASLYESETLHYVEVEHGGQVRTLSADNPLTEAEIQARLLRELPLPPIALCGQLRAGKDAVAAYLVRHYGYTRFAFGDGIREVTRRLYPEAYEGSEKPRALLQGFGQMARSFGADVWVNDCFRRMKEREGALRSLDAQAGMWGATIFRPVITDLRQPNEYERCRAEGYVIIRVTAPEEIRLERARQAGDAFTAEDLVHETEQHIAGFAVDYEVDNSGSLAELYASVDAVMGSLIARPESAEVSV